MKVTNSGSETVLKKKLRVFLRPGEKFVFKQPRCKHRKNSRPLPILSEIR